MNKLLILSFFATQLILSANADTIPPLSPLPDNPIIPSGHLILHDSYNDGYYTDIRELLIKFTGRLPENASQEILVSLRRSGFSGIADSSFTSIHSDSVSFDTLGNWWRTPYLSVSIYDTISKSYSTVDTTINAVCLDDCLIDTGKPIVTGPSLSDSQSYDRIEFINNEIRLSGIIGGSCGRYMVFTETKHDSIIIKSLEYCYCTDTIWKRYYSCSKCG